MSFSIREKAESLTDKITCFRRSIFRSVNDRNDAKDKLKIFYANYFAQCEAYKRELIIASEQKNDNYANADNNKDNDSSIE